MLENRSVGKMGMQQQQATAGKEFSRDKQSSLSNGHVEEKCLSANVQVWPPEQTSGRQFQDAGMDHTRKAYLAIGGWYEPRYRTCLSYKCSCYGRRNQDTWQR
jgi:hypothetical protein